MDAEKKRIVDEAVERLSNLTANRAGVVAVDVSTLDLLDTALSYAIEAAAEGRQAKAVERFQSAKVEDVSRHIKGLEEIGDRAEAIAQSLRGYARAIDEYVDAVTSAFRSGDIALVALKRRELLRCYGIAEHAANDREVTPIAALDLLQIGEDNGELDVASR